ncbi:PilW family protein [Shewanella sp. AS1]|uniref:PilW family protein n=1 Tax=Shewanella sp. AS1 TaxID=2907626 RepID=UPI001F36EEE0|nr:PilW family protein [Shewanella sp. AS1]MCE9678011.1 PilW family protein [Shewanella sp. AS1]
MKTITNNFAKFQTGMSLVELMVAMVIALFLTAGVFTMFSMSSSNVTTTSQFNQLQENGRIALAIMEKDLSQVGFFGDMTGTDLSVGIEGNTTVLSAAVPNDCIGGVNNASLPIGTPAHFRLIWGYEQGVGGASLTCLNTVNAVNTNTDVLQLKRLVGPNTLLPTAATRHYVATTSDGATFFTGNQTTPTITNARFWEYQHHVYFIKDDGDIPVLRRRTLTTVNGMNNEEQLVEGIENMRILYGIDDENGDGVPNRFVPATSISNSMWLNMQSWRIVAVKVYLLVRSIKQDRTYTNETTYQLGDKAIAAPNDNYRRKVMSTTVVLENPVLISG